MPSKRGHRQFKDLRKAVLMNGQVFPGYPHRRHRKDAPTFQQSPIKRRKESYRIKELESEIKNFIK